MKSIRAMETTIATAVSKTEAMTSSECYEKVSDRDLTQWLALLCMLLCVTVFGANKASAEDSLAVELEQLKVMLETDRNKMLFIDVRDPVEIMFTGFTNAVDANIPYQMVDRHDWNAKKNVFRMNLNPRFAMQVEQLLAEMGLDKTATVVTMCRSGSARGKPSAAYLREQGFENALYLVNGFQGSKLKDGSKKGIRIKNGWQNSGMPWQSKANPEKIFKP